MWIINRYCFRITFGWFEFGAKLPEQVRTIIQGYVDEQDAHRTDKEWYAIKVQAVTAIFLIIALANHLAHQLV